MMLLKNIPLAIKDFEKLQWAELIKKSEKKVCQCYSPIFFEKAYEAEGKGDVKTTEVFALLGSVTSMTLKSDSSTEPLIPMFVKIDDINLQESKISAIERVAVEKTQDDIEDMHETGSSS